MGHTLIVKTIGFRDDLRPDLAGSFLTSAAKVTEKFRRSDVGHLEIKATVDDSGAYTKPWTVISSRRLSSTLVPSARSVSRTKSPIGDSE